MRTLILGFDALDPAFFEDLISQGKLPNLRKWAEAGRYSSFNISNPAQSEVSWTSIATGLAPSDHGMFDFVHRDPKTYRLYVSLLPSAKGIGGLQFQRPFRARTIFDMAAERGYPATSLWWPATFPARPESPVRTLPGLGTPDIQGRLGVGVLYTTETGLPGKMGKTPLHVLESRSPGSWIGQFEGPTHHSGSGTQSARLDFKLTDRQHDQVILSFAKQEIALTPGAWSPILELVFKIGFLVNVRAITRVIITRSDTTLRMYALPLQIHPLHAIWRYGSPASFVKDAWRSAGPFLTLGWPQDTTGLEDGCITDDQFLDLCDSIVAARFKLLLHMIDSFKEGLLASVFDTLDRVSHMFWGRNPALIERWYARFDDIAGQVMARLAASPGKDYKPARLLIVSDHGFNRFDYKVHLNRRLLEEGFLASTGDPNAGTFSSVNWNRTQAYAIGLNSVYLNQTGREGIGCVSASQREAGLDRLTEALSGWNGPDGRPVVQKVYRRGVDYSGALVELAPDLLIGYSPGYRGSAETGLGGWKANALEPNRDHWGADHCFDPVSVPGVVFSSSDLSNYPSPSFRDIPAMAIDAAPDASGTAPPPPINSEDQAAVEERLKSLGYL